MTEKVLETRTCRHCFTKFDITDVDVDFLTRLSPTIGGKRFELPLPTHCPKCRKIRRYSWRNEKNIYKRKCDATGKDIISLFSPDAPCPVYESDYWYSDAWDAKKYGRDFDFSKSFFEQWGELKKIVPMPGKAISQIMENSDYSDNCSNLKNCYLVFNAGGTDDSLYVVDVWFSDHCIDSLSIYDCHYCYELLDARNCYNVHFSYDLRDCRDSMFLYDCEGCQNCYGCFGLRNQQYFLYNRSFTKEEYENELKKISILSYSEQRSIFEAFLKLNGYHSPVPKNTGSENTYDCARVFDSKNVYSSTIINDSEDIRYSGRLRDTRLAMDVDIWGDRLDRAYESHQIGEAANSVYFSVCCWANVSNLYYSSYCMQNVKNCFGCIGLKDSEYCILNKQYTKDEYESLVPKIIEKMIFDGEWGEFFPAKYSHFGYNQTMNIVKSPLSREETIGISPLIKGNVTEGQGDFVSENLQKQNPPKPLGQGGTSIETFLHGPLFNWSDYEAPFPKVEKVIPASKLPDTIEGIPDDILNWAIECEVSGKPFRIVKSELEFYRKHNLPIPRKHPDERYKDRTKIYINY